MGNHQERQQQQQKKKMYHFSHNHQLTLIEIEDEIEEEMSRSFLRCSGCTEKIGPGVPYYRCEEDCPSFCLHHACAHLPTTIRKIHTPFPCKGELRLKRLPHQNHQSCDYYIHAAANDDCLTSTIRKRDVQHSDHDHPLALVLEQQQEAPPTLDCHCCSEKISSSVPYYTCTHCKSYHLHSLCTSLPVEIEHPLHPNCPLKLVSWRLSVICDECNQECKGFAYNCSTCNFDLDIECALRAQTVVKIFHKHPLFLSLVKGPFNCNACDGNAEGTSYQCTSCKFWVHQQCAAIPTLKVTSSHQPGYEHEHDLELVYTIPEKYSGVVVYCRICTKALNDHIWAYHCKYCRYLTHIHNCFNPHREGDGFTINPSEVIHLPLSGEPILEEKLTNGKMIKHHRHPMILFGDQFESHAIAVAASFRNLIRGSKTWPTFHVDGKDYSGSSFSFHNNVLTMQATSVDLPRFIKHESHPHVLESTFLNSSTWCHACEQIFFGRGFKCTTCAFTLDTYCGLLPKMIKHRYDKHGFSLTYYAVEGIEEYVCEICEEDVTPTYFYHCVACDQSIHARCIWKAYLRLVPAYEIRRFRQVGNLVPPGKHLPQCIICDQKETFGHGFAFVWPKNSNEVFRVHLTCLSEDDVQT